VTKLAKLGNINTLARYRNVKQSGVADLVSQALLSFFRFKRHFTISIYLYIDLILVYK